MVFETAGTNLPNQQGLIIINVLSRARDDDPGLQEAEAGFIRLLDKMTNGSKVRKKGTGQPSL